MKKDTFPQKNILVKLKNKGIKSVPPGISKSPVSGYRVLFNSNGSLLPQLFLFPETIQI